MAKKTTSVNKKVKQGAAALAGIIAAAAAGYLLFGPQGKKNRKKMQDWMMDAKAEIVQQAKKAKAVSKKEFNEVIEGVMKGYTDLKKISKNEAREFKNELMENWDKLAVMLVKGDYTNLEKTVSSNVKKHAGSVAAKATKKVMKKTLPSKEKVVKKTKVKKK